MREFSASSTITQLSKTRAEGAPVVVHRDVTGPASMPARLREPEDRARTSRPRKIAGSAKQAKVTSRAAPIPSNDEPVSRAAHAVKNRPRPSKYANRITSPSNEIGALPWAKGTTSAPMPTVTRPTTGPARNTQVVVGLKTEPFRKS